MGVDPSAMFPGFSTMDGLPGLSAPQGMSNGHDTAMSGTGMLDEQVLADFDGMPMTLDANNLDNINGSKPPTSLNTAMAQSDLEQLDDKGKPGRSPVDKQMTGAGAGPLPTGFGAQSNLGGGSTLTEFTKRRNWSQRVVEELKDFLHILTPDGRIVYLSPSGKHLTGYPQEELVGKFIVDFIHPDDSSIFVREFNESIASGNPLRFFYRFRKKNGTYTIFESHGHPHLTSEAAAFGPNNAAGFCREEAEEADNAHRNWGRKQEGRSDNPSEEIDTMGGTSITTSLPALMSNPDVMAMPPPAKPSGLNVALTRQNLEDANASSRPDSINDKMARYEGATHIETIEMLTGLRYQDGERSRGISTGDQSPALIKGDAGIAIAVDKDTRANDKRKKIKLPDEYEHLIHLNGARDRVGQRHYVMHVVCGGRKEKRRNQDPVKGLQLCHWGQVLAVDYDIFALSLLRA
ncbi:hypothetical protein G7Y89_g3088 [Cudoniella acicularis]|uniref:PAS domain-containing protein n=1 Tax=Cudoniella acicularis TaxID=354080 RepID=A0A8H4W5I3_9HELO|nr:hypothetical protein G7Y89_g3088 [Cudoniella acicularis]